MSLRATLLFGALRLFARFSGEMTPEGLRRLAPSTPPEVDGVTFRAASLGDVTVEIAEPSGDLVHEILFLHGGAYVAGSPGTARRLLGSWCRESGSRGWSVDYRLAPEHPYPAGLDDARAAWLSLLETGVDPNRAVLAGESAGGGLALCLAVALRDEGLPLPGRLVLFWPWTDLTLSGAAIAENRRRDFLTDSLLDMGRRAYAGDLDVGDPRVSPLFADLHGLPPTLLQVGGYDRVRDDSTRLAPLLDYAELQVYPKLPHGWGAEGDTLREARASIARAASWLQHS